MSNNSVLPKIYETAIISKESKINDKKNRMLNNHLAYLKIIRVKRTILKKIHNHRLYKTLFLSNSIN